MANDVTYLGLSQSVIQRGNIMTKELYNGTPTGHYWYTGVSSIVFNVVFFGAHLTRDIGMEHSAPVVTILSLTPCMPGCVSFYLPHHCA